MTRQSSNGAFGLWAADSDDDDLWLDAFVTDFLTRARERNFAVPQPGFDHALDHLRNTVVNAADPAEGAGEPLAYALYVLARNGRPVIGDLRYLADTKLDDLQDAARQGADRRRARDARRSRARRQGVSPPRSTRCEAEQDNGSSRPDYGSRLRDAAAMLALLAEADLTDGELPGDPIARAGAALDSARARERLHQHAGEQLDGARRRGAGRAQDARPVRPSTASRSKARSTANGAASRSASKLATIANTGEATARSSSRRSSGVPVAPEPAASQGYEIERTFYKLDGTKIELKSITQNERVVVVLKVTESEARYAKLLVVDRLPAGLEIDNPDAVRQRLGRRLLLAEARHRSGPHRISRRPLRRRVRPRAAASRRSSRVAYVVRAVAPGIYVYPPATAEDMYRPDRFGRTALRRDRGEGEVSGSRPPAKLRAR